MDYIVCPSGNIQAELHVQYIVKLAENVPTNTM